VEILRHLFRFSDGDCTECSRLIWSAPEAFRRSTTQPEPTEESTRLRQAWQRRWPGQAPIAHQLRANERWLRFHSLPGSQRYAQNESEYDELTRRHHTALAELAQHAKTPGPMMVVTCPSLPETSLATTACHLSRQPTTRPPYRADDAGCPPGPTRTTRGTATCRYTRWPTLVAWMTTFSTSCRRTA
jgi:hypothetical protein